METCFYVFTISPKLCTNNCCLLHNLKVRLKSPCRNSALVSVKRINVSRWIHGRWIVNRDKMPKLIWSKLFNYVLRILKSTGKFAWPRNTVTWLPMVPWRYIRLCNPYIHARKGLIIFKWYLISPCSICRHHHFKYASWCQSILSVVFPLYMSTGRNPAGKLTDGAFIPLLKAS